MGSMTVGQRIVAAWRLLTRGIGEFRPDLAGREHLMSVRSDEAAQPSPYSYLSAVADYGSYVWLKKAAKIIADSVASLPVYVSDRNGEAVESHPLAVLFSQVNSAMSPSDLWQWWTIDMLLGGESFLELVKSGSRYAEIWPRQPHTVKIEQSDRRYYRPSGYVIEDADGRYPLPPEECLHFKFYNPANPWRGLSVAQAARMSTSTDKLAAVWSQRFYMNAARPDWAVIAPQGITPTEMQSMMDTIMATYGGAGNAWKPIVLEQGITDIKTLSYPPKDLEWIEQRKLSRSEVAALFGVPDEIMGYGRDTYENFNTAMRVLWTQTVRPITDLRDSTATEFFRRVGALRPDESIATDYSGVPELREDFGAKLDQAVKLFGMGVPFNVIDETLGLGVGQIEGGDVGYLSAGLSTVADVLAPPEPMPQIVEPDSDNMEGQPGEGAAPKAYRHGERMEFGSPEHRGAWEAYAKRLAPHERKLGAVVAALIADQRDEVLERLRRESKAASDVARNPFDMKAWVKRFRIAVRPVIREVVREYGQEAMRDVRPGVSFDLTDPRVVTFLQGREQRFAERVNETTWGRLKDSIAQGIEAGESIPDIAARVEGIMSDRIRSSPETIARTEVVGASNGGTVESWRQSGVVQGKQWLATLDDRVRESHSEAHGQIVGLDDDFDVGGGSGPAPGQIGVAGEDINCRCTVLAVLGE